MPRRKTFYKLLICILFLGVTILSIEWLSSSVTNFSNFLQISNDFFCFIQKKEKITKFEGKSIAVFVHVGTRGANWISALERVLKAANNSGLMNFVDYFFICMVGDQKFPQSLIKYTENVSIVQLSKSAEDYEFPTLQFMFNFSRTHPQSYMLYLHNKGATKSSKYVDAWVEYLLFWDVYQWDSALEILEEENITTVFVDLLFPGQSDTNWFRVGGNFFWTKASYAQTLPDPVLNRSKLAKKGQPSRYGAERWIVFPLDLCDANSTCREERLTHFCSMNQSPERIDPYHYLYIREKYEPLAQNILCHQF